MNRRNFYWFSWLLVLLALVLVACGKDASADDLPAPDSVGDPIAGQQIFVTRHDEVPSCSFCHNVDSDKAKTGPSLQNIANVAGSRVDGMNAEEYLRQSILDPNAYIADGKARSRMYAHFADVLTPEEIDNLVAYLLTLR
ncbi:MAG: hypothetical protein BroJett018_48200 [Chloroflexota bacterium]|nr:cytochrome c [Chloroflexota bacterium]GIK67026.1 MAG: hypothetical protein BroJett018_48200 [Chloroflexota bacterium]